MLYSILLTISYRPTVIQSADFINITIIQKKAVPLRPSKSFKIERYYNTIVESKKRPDISSESNSKLNWAALRSCEGSYTSNTGNGFYGAYQFDLQTWQSVGGSGLPSNASPAEQDMRAQKLYDQRGASPWPVCGKLL